MLKSIYKSMQFTNKTINFAKNYLPYIISEMSYTMTSKSWCDSLKKLEI